MPRQTDLSRVRVAAGILRDARGRVLVTERTGDVAFAGLWEFPGGKIRDGETSVSALRRELQEELGIEVREPALFMKLDHDYPDRSVSIDFYLVGDWQNSPVPRDGQGMRWINPENLDESMLLPADGPVVEALKRESGS